MEKKKKINYKKRRRRLIFGIIIFLIFISNLCAYLDKKESKRLAERTFRDREKEINYDEK
jgi:hypothetical protein